MPNAPPRSSPHHDPFNELGIHLGQARAVVGLLPAALPNPGDAPDLLRDRLDRAYSLATLVEELLDQATDDRDRLDAVLIGERP